MIELAIAAVVGLMMLVLGVWSLRTRAYDDRVSIIEAAVLKATGAAPLPLGRVDRAWGFAQAWAMAIFGGGIFALFGAIIVIGLFEDGL